MRKYYLLSILFFITCQNLYSQVVRDSSKVAWTLPIDEVIVTGSKYQSAIRQMPMTISVIGSKKLESTKRVSILPTLTEQVPGLFITARGVMGYGVSTGAAGGMTMRGIGHGNQDGPTTGVLVLIDGHPQYMGMMGHPIADAYQNMIADKVEVVRGPASVLYGSNAMGGVINIITQKMVRNGVRTNASVSYGSYNTFQSEISNRVKRDKFSSFVSASYNRSDGSRKNMDFEQYGGIAKVDYQLTKNWNAWADLNITHFNATNPGTIFNPITDNTFNITRGITTVALENKYDKSSGSISFYYNWGRHKINDGYAQGKQPQVTRFNSKDNLLGVSLYESISFFEGTRITLGFDYKHYGGKAWNYNLNSKDNSTIADKSQNNVAGYVNIHQIISSFLAIDAGVRVDHLSNVGTEWVPQTGLTFYTSKNSELKAMISKGFRFPTIREMYMFPPQNPNLKSEKLMNYELAFSQRLIDNRLYYAANIFYINGKNIITNMIVDSRPKYLNIGKVRNYGVELEASYSIDQKWQANANYSWLHMKYPVIAAPKNKAFVGISYKNNKFSANTGLQFIYGLYTSINPETEEHAYLLWNLTAQYDFTKFLSFYVRGENLLAQKYEINLGYPMPRATFMVGINLKF